MNAKRKLPKFPEKLLNICAAVLNAYQSCQGKLALQGDTSVPPLNGDI